MEVSDRSGSEDTHLRMSKKIAQLTRVIYHLHTANDNRLFELSSLQRHYESEIEHVSRDAHTKMETYRRQVQELQRGTEAQEAIRRFAEEQERERDRILAELRRQQEVSATELGVVRRESQQVISSLGSELASVKSDFEKRIKAFSDTIHEMTEKHRHETRSLQDDRDAEVARVVRESNDRYHQMLAEKLTEIDQLEKDFERRLREANQSAASGADAQLKSALDRQQQEFEKKLDEAARRYEKLFQDLESQRQLEANLRTQLTSLQHQIAEQNTSHDHEVQSLRSEIRLVQDNLDVALDVKSSLQSQLQTLEREKVELERQLSSFRANQQQLTENNTSLSVQLEAALCKVSDLEGELATLRSQFASDQLQISDALTSKDDEIRDLRSKLGDATREIDTCMSRMQEEETRFTSQIDSLREELHQVSTTARTREQENDLFIQKLHKDHEDLIQQLNLQHQSALNDLRNSLSNDSSAALRARDEEIREIEEKYKKILEDAEKEHLEFKSQAHTRFQEYDAQIQYLEMQVSSLEQARKDLEEKAGANENELRIELENKINEINSLNQQIDELRHSLRHEEENSLEKSRLLNEAIARAEKFGEEEQRRLFEQISILEKQKQELQSSVQQLSDSIEKNRALFEEEKETLSQQHDLAVKTIHEDWESKIKRMIADLQENAAKREQESLKEQKNELCKQHEADLLQARTEWNETRVALEKQISDLENRFSSSSSDAEKKIKHLQEEIDRIKLESESKISAAQQEWQFEKDELHVRMERERLELENAHSRAIEILKADFEVKIESERQISEIAREKAVEEEKLHGLQLVSNTRQSCELEKEKALSDLRQSLSKKYEEEIADVKKQFERERLEMQEAHSSSSSVYLSQISSLEERVSSLSSSLEDRMKQITRLEENISDLEKNLATSNSELRSKVEEMMQLKRNLTDELAQRERELLVDRQKALEELARQHRDELDRFLSGLEDERAVWSQEQAELIERYRILEEKYMNRESLPEDLERIEYLEAAVVEKDDLLTKAYEDMKMYKLELLNREESYNKTFGRQPNVGFMNPLSNASSSSNLAFSGKKGNATVASSAGTKPPKKGSLPSIGSNSTANSSRSRPPSASRTKNSR